MKVISIHVDPVAMAEKLRFPWYTDLVGGIPTPLKNMSSSDWIIIPTIGQKQIKRHVPNHQAVIYMVLVGGFNHLEKY